MNRAGLLSLVALTLASIVWGGDTNLRTGPYLRTRTFQSVAAASPFWGNYLTLDDANVPTTNTLDAREDSGTWWQIKMVGKHKDYTSHVIVNRGHNAANGHYLCVDATGQLYLSNKETDTSYWLIRYTGQVNGYDSWIIQVLPQNATQFDLMFLALHDDTGKPILTRKLQPQCYWHMHAAPDLPTESKYN